MEKSPSIPCLAMSGLTIERYLCERDRCLPVPLETKLSAMRIKTSQIRRNLDKTLDNIYQMKKLQGFEGDN
jgi:very-short-patch-repair endonuclease